MMFKAVDYLWSSQYNWRPWWKLLAWSRPDRRNFQMMWFLSGPRDWWSSPLPHHSHHCWCTVDLLNTEFCTVDQVWSDLVSTNWRCRAESEIKSDQKIPSAASCLSLPCRWWLPGSCQRTLQLQLQSGCRVIRFALYMTLLLRPLFYDIKILYLDILCAFTAYKGSLFIWQNGTDRGQNCQKYDDLSYPIFSKQISEQIWDTDYWLLTLTGEERPQTVVPELLTLLQRQNHMSKVVPVHVSPGL